MFADPLMSGKSHVRRPPYFFGVAFVQA